MKRCTDTILLMLLAIVACCGPVFAGVHLNKKMLPLQCATCHYKKNLRSGGGPDTCIACHGKTKSRAVASRMPAGATKNTEGLKNIEDEFYKLYRHPVFDTPGLHRANEILPEVDSKAPRHAECVDCHNPHLVTKDDLFAGMKVTRVVNKMVTVSKESQICYRCHGDSANLPGKYTNKRIEFSLNNPSFHPVEGEGKNSFVVSLLRPYREKKLEPGDISILTCGDCHGNDDENGPKGPHGSRFPYILKDNFDTADNISESPQTYALCYRCHSRTSILANESFRFHALHIKGKNSTQYGTSCFTCHNSHGSPEYKYLIRFNTSVVSPNAKGVLKFVEKGYGKFSGECYLNCHDVEHDPKSY